MPCFFNYDVERQLTHPPIITLPNLRWFGLQGDNMCIEVLVRRITTPLLEKLGLVKILLRRSISLLNIRIICGQGAHGGRMMFRMVRNLVTPHRRRIRRGTLSLSGKGGRWEITLRSCYPNCRSSRTLMLGAAMPAMSSSPSSMPSRT